MTREQDLKLKATAEGFDAAAKKVDGVTEAQARLDGQTKKGAGATTEAAAAQDKLNASESDFVSLLTQISPALGASVDAAIKATNISGDLASQNINLAGTVSAVTTAVIKNAQAIKLLLAGGAAVAGVLALVAAYGKMKEELAGVNDQLERQKTIQNELKGASQDRQKEIEGISDTRRGGGLTAEDARAAAATATNINQQFDQLSPAAVNEAVGKAGDLGLSPPQLAQVAFLIQNRGLQLDNNATADQTRSQIERSVRRNQEASEIFFGRETQQGQGTTKVVGELAKGAQRELLGGDGTTVDIERVIEKIVGRISDEDKTALLDELARFPTSGAVEARRNQKIPATVDDPFPDGSIVGSQAEQVRSAIERGVSVTIINNHGGNIVPESGANQSGLRLNGQNVLRNAENVGGN